MPFWEHNVRVKCKHTLYDTHLLMKQVMSICIITTCFGLESIIWPVFKIYRGLLSQNYYTVFEKRVLGS